jgi:putative methionine-R-sulfoxide reductase with GAF domain
MDMVCHQAVRMQRTVVLQGQLANVRQVDEVITIGPETRGAIVTPLNDVDRYAGEHQAQGSGHSNTTTTYLVDEIAL